MRMRLFYMDQSLWVILYRLDPLLWLFPTFRKSKKKNWLFFLIMLTRKIKNKNKNKSFLAVIAYCKNYSDTSLSDAFLQMMPTVVAAVSTIVWQWCRPVSSYLMVPYLTAVGFLFATLVGQIVVARVCGKMGYTWRQPLVVPLVLGLFNALSNL